MSKHIYYDKASDKSIEMGWDRPLQMYYCVVWPGNDIDSAEEPLYSNLSEPQLRNPLDHYMTKIAGFDIKLPEGMIGAVVHDRSIDLVNEVRVWE